MPELVMFGRHMSMPHKIPDADPDKDAAATKIQAGFTGMMVRQELEADSLEKQMEKPTEEDLSKGEEVAVDGDELMIPRDPEQGRKFTCPSV